MRYSPLGPVAFVEQSGLEALLPQVRLWGERAAEAIDAAVPDISEQNCKRACDVLLKYRALLDELAVELKECEESSGAELRQRVAAWHSAAQPDARALAAAG